MTQILYQQNSFSFFWHQMLLKIMVHVQNKLRGASVKACFWLGEDIGHAEKKAPNSDFHWGLLRGEMDK